MAPIDEWALLRLIGSGKLSFVTPMVVTNDSDGRPHAAEPLIVSSPNRLPASIPQASHIFFNRLLAQRQRLHGDVQEAFAMDRWNFTDDPRSDNFRLLLSDVHTTGTLSCEEKLPLRTKEVQTGMFKLSKPKVDTWLGKPSRKASRTDKIEKRLDAEPVDSDIGSSDGDSAERSWSSAEDPLEESHDGETDEEAHDGEEDEAHDGREEEEDEKIAEFPHEPWNAAGLKSFDMPSTARSFCFICTGKVEKNTYR